MHVCWPHKCRPLIAVVSRRCGTQEGMGADVVGEVQDNFVERYTATAAFGACVSFVNFFLVRHMHVVTCICMCTLHM